MTITVNVARNADEAERLARGENVTVRREGGADEDEAEATKAAKAAAEAVFEPDAADAEGESAEAAPPRTRRSPPSRSRGPEARPRPRRPNSPGAQSKMSNCGGGGAGGGGGGAASGAGGAAAACRCRLLTSALVARRGLRPGGLDSGRSRRGRRRRGCRRRCLVARTCRRARRCRTASFRCCCCCRGVRASFGPGAGSGPNQDGLSAPAPGAPRGLVARAARGSGCAGSCWKPQQIVGERRRAFAAVGVVLAQEAREAGLALVLGKPLRPLVAAAAGAVGRKQRGRGLGAEVFAPHRGLWRAVVALRAGRRSAPKAEHGSHRCRTTPKRPPASDAYHRQPDLPARALRASDHPNPLFNP